MRKNVLQRFYAFCLLGLSIVFLAACNGSSEEAVDDNNDRGLVDNPGTDKVPAAPVLSLALATKQLQFTWPAEAGVDHYQLMSNPDGATGFAQIGDDIPGASTATTLEIAVHRLNWPNATYLLRACNNNNQCSDSNTVSTLNSMTQAIGYIKASNPDAHDNFGISVALSADGKTLVVGSFGEDSDATGIDGDQTNNDLSGTGAVYVYIGNGSNWRQQAYIKASATQMGYDFGRVLSLSADGNTLAVGALGDNSSATGIGGEQTTDDSAAYSGAVYVYARNGDSWSQEAYIKASNTEEGDYFGSSVALSADGNTLAVGAVGEDSNVVGVDGEQLNYGAYGSGAVYVYVREGNWQQQAYIKASNTGAGDDFGTSVALSASGNLLAVGAVGEDGAGLADEENNSAENAGAVYVFSRDNNNWAQQAYVKASNSETDDNLGFSLALSADGNTLTVGSKWEDGAAKGLEGDQTDNSAYSAGAVYVFGRADNSWAQQAYVKASNTEESDLFGASVALSADGNTLAVGAIGEGSQLIGDQTDDSAFAAGAVYLY